VTGRPAPAPTEPGKNGPRLSPALPEWMMGLPEGWITSVPDVPRSAQLKAAGNSVVVLQCAEALRILRAAEHWAGTWKASAA
jgi:DNA (cytosine-5)-methyltransferase 1